MLQKTYVLIGIHEHTWFMYGPIERDMIGSVSCNKSNTRICVKGRGVSFRGGFSSGRRGVASSSSRVRWDLSPCRTHVRSSRKNPGAYVPCVSTKPTWAHGEHIAYAYEWANENILYAITDGPTCY